MSIWAILLILFAAGIFVILLRRLPAAIKDTQQAMPTPVSVPAEVKAEIKTKPSPKSKPVIAIPAIPAMPKLKSFPSFGFKKKNKEENQVKPAKAESLANLPVEVLVERGEQAFQTKDYDKARVIYEELVGREEGPKWYTRLGAVDLELERFHDAREAFRSALKFGDEVASRHANLGMAEFALGHRLTATRYLRTAVALAPNSRRYQELLDSIESSK